MTIATTFQPLQTTNVSAFVGPQAAKPSLIVDPAQVSLSFTNDRELDPGTLAPGKVVVDIGRQAAVDTVEVDGVRHAKAVVDHHQLARGTSATQLVYANQNAIADSGKITEIGTHANPDLDAIVSVMLVNVLRTGGALPVDLKGLVDYVTAWDSGALHFANVDELQHTLGIVVMGLSKIAEDQVETEVLQTMQLQHMGQVYPDPALKSTFFSQFNQKIGPRQIELVSRFIDSLYQAGYDVGELKSLPLQSSVPGHIHGIYQQAVEKMQQDIEWFYRQREPKAKFFMSLAGENERGAVRIGIEPSTNTVSAFYDYLYTMGTMGGLIYKENIDTLPNGKPMGKDYQKEKPYLKACKVVLAISDQAGASITGVSNYLNEIEIQTRRALGIKETPEKEKAFWKETVPGRMLLTTEGTVLTREQVVVALKVYKPYNEPELNEYVADPEEVLSMVRLGFAHQTPSLLSVTSSFDELAAQIPEMAAMVGFDQRSDFHTLPLDGHTKEGGRILEEDPVIAMHRKRDLILFAYKYHDLGKTSPDGQQVHADDPSKRRYVGHEAEGARMVAELLPKYFPGMSVEDQALVVHLVALHGGILKSLDNFSSNKYQPKGGALGVFDDFLAEVEAIPGSMGREEKMRIILAITRADVLATTRKDPDLENPNVRRVFEFAQSQVRTLDEISRALPVLIQAIDRRRNGDQYAGLVLKDGQYQLFEKPREAGEMEPKKIALVMENFDKFGLDPSQSEAFKQALTAGIPGLGKAGFVKTIPLIKLVLAVSTAPFPIEQEKIDLVMGQFDRLPVPSSQQALFHSSLADGGVQELLNRGFDLKVIGKVMQILGIKV